MEVAWYIPYVELSVGTFLMVEKYEQIPLRTPAIQLLKFSITINRYIRNVWRTRQFVSSLVFLNCGSKGSCVT